MRQQNRASPISPQMHDDAHVCRCDMTYRCDIAVPNAYPAAYHYVHNGLQFCLIAIIYPSYKILCTSVFLVVHNYVTLVFSHFPSSAIVVPSPHLTDKSTRCSQMA